MKGLQSPRFTPRDLCEEDLSECFGFNPSHIGQEIVGFQRALSAWKSIVGTPASGGTVIEADPPQAGFRIAGFGVKVFVSRDFADSEIADPRPGINARLVASIDAGQPVALTKSEIRHANTHCGLDIVSLGGWRPGMLGDPEAAEAYSLLASSFLEIHAGYWVNRLITEITGEADRRMRTREGIWRLIANFETFYARNPGSLWAPGRALAIITREEAFSITGHSMITLFRQCRPQLRLRDADQHFLAVAMSGLTDEELSRRLKISRTSVKKRWLSLFERVSAIRPDLAPDTADASDRQTRGRQKRHLLLAYLRAHPEELQPYQW